MKRALFALLLCTACTGRYDNAGYRLPDTSLVGTTCIVTIASDADMKNRAATFGFAQKRGQVLNAYHQRIGNGCLITIGESALYAYAPSLAHELHHEKGWVHD